MSIFGNRQQVLSIHAEAWGTLDRLLRRVGREITRWHAESSDATLIKTSIYDGVDWDIVGDQILEEIERENTEHAKYLDFLSRSAVDHALISDAPYDDVHELTALLSDALEQVESRDVEAVQDSVSLLEASCVYDVRYRTKHLFDEIGQTLEVLQADTPTLLWVPRSLPLYTPRLIVQAGDELLAYLASNPRALYGISPRRFEEVVADLFARQGFDVQLTKATRDGGRDIIAIERRMDVLIKILIECKRYAEANKVTLSVVQRLFGVKVAEAANKAVLVTTSSFTRDARAFAAAHIWDLELKDHTALMQWLRPYA